MINKSKPISLLLLLAFCLLFVSSIKAQGIPYKTAIGWRFGGTEGLTIKVGLNKNAAFEGIIGLWPYGMGLTGLYEIHQSTSLNNLNWYYGGGAHIVWSTARNYYYNNNRKYLVYDRKTAFGVDGIIGLEFKIPNAPIAISLDLKPTFSFYNNGGAYAYIDPGLGLKAAF